MFKVFCERLGQRFSGICPDTEKVEVQHVEKNCMQYLKRQTIFTLYCIFVLLFFFFTKG